MTPLKRLFEDIKRLSLAKCNSITFHITDNLGNCCKSDVFTPLKDIRGTSLYTKEEMKELADFCEKLCINAVSGIEFPAHGTFLTENPPELKCQTSENSVYTVCVGSEKVYEFYSKLIGEVCSIFPSGTTFAAGKAAPRAKNNAIEKPRRHFRPLQPRDRPHAQNREQKRQKMIMYNNELDVSKELPTNKDIIIQFWRIADENRGPSKGCTFDKFAKQGFKIINSVVENCYIDLAYYANPEKIAAFS